jgi:xylulokinase
MMADIYNMPVQRPALLEEATSLGAALAGGIAVGLYKDFSLAEELTPIVDTVLPNPVVKPLYDRLYKVFNRAYEAVAPLYEELAAV